MPEEGGHSCNSSPPFSAEGAGRNGALVELGEVVDARLASASCGLRKVIDKPLNLVPASPALPWKSLVLRLCDIASERGPIRAGEVRDNDEYEVGAFRVEGLVRRADNADLRSIDTNAWSVARCAESGHLLLIRSGIALRGELCQANKDVCVWIARIIVEIAKFTGDPVVLSNVPWIAVGRCRPVDAL